MEALSAFGPAIECVEVLALVVVGASLWCQLEMGGDHIGDIDQHGGCALLAVLIHQNFQVGQIASVHRLFDLASRSLVANLVAADRLKADRLQRVDLVDDPADCRLPVNGFEDAARADGVITS